MTRAGLPGHVSTLDRLPEDIILYILRHLNVQSISSLARTCRVLYSIVEHSGWKIYAIENPLPSLSLSPALRYSRWSMRDLVRQQRLAKKGWKSRKYVTRPLGPEWASKFHPVMAINASRLVVAAGNGLYCYRFTPPTGKHAETPRVVFERVLTFPNDAWRDISGIAFEPDGQSVVLSFFHGALGRIRLPQSSESTRRRSVFTWAPNPSYIQEQGPPIRSMSVVQDIALTIDALGRGSLYSISDQVQPLLSRVETTRRAAGWSTHLSLRSSSGYAVLGTASAVPLVVHAITEAEFIPYPQTILSLPSKASTTSKPRSVYAITGATRAPSLFSASDQIVISGWYQGIITLHDLRCPTLPDPSGGTPSLLPAQTWHDPLTLSPIYSLSSAGAHIAAGSARNSLLHLYDVRFPKGGWSIYLPQGRSTSSPVYSCLLESTRLWAATESRAFVVDFGEVHERTFPSVHDRNVMANSTDSLGWHSPCCEHSLFYNSQNITR